MTDSTMNKAMAQKLSDEIARAAKEIGERLGMDVANKGGRYNETGGTFAPRLEFRMREIGGVDREQAQFNVYCDAFGLDPKHYGVEIKSPQGQIYKVVGFRPRAKNSVIVARVPDGKRFVMPDRILDQIEGRRGKWSDSLSARMEESR